MELQEIFEVISNKKDELQRLYKEEATIKESAAFFEREMESLRSKLKEVERSSASVFEKKDRLEKEIGELSSMLKSIRNIVSSVPAGFVSPTSPTCATERKEIANKILEPIIPTEEQITYVTGNKDIIFLKEVYLTNLVGWQLRKLIWKSGEEVDRTSTQKILFNICEHISADTIIPLSEFDVIALNSKRNVTDKFSLMRRVMERYSYSLDEYIKDNVKMYGFHSQKNK